MVQRRVSLHAGNGLSVWACSYDDGRLSIVGHDLNPPIGKEYEYSLTVAAGDVPRVLEALGGYDDQDVLELVEAHAAAIVKGGEMSWFQSLGIKPEFWSRIGD
jgi:hypothetical protein